MAKKLSYEELEHRVKELEKKTIEAEKTREEIERLKSAVEQSIDGIGIGNDGEGFTYVNKAYAAMHGYSPEEMIGMSIWTVYDQELPEQRDDILKQLSTQGSYRGETGRIRKDGTTFLAFQSTTAMKFPGSKVRWAVTICKDITEQKAAEERIRTLSSAVDRSIDGIAIGNESRFDYVNEAYAAMHGYSPQEMIGMSVLNVYDPKFREQAPDVFEQIHAQGSFQGEVRHIRKDGTHFVAFQSITAMEFSGGEVRGGVSICRDITEEKWSKERIRTLSSAVEQSIDGISIGNEENGLTYVNKAFAAMHGYSPEEMMGMTAHDFLKEDSLISLKEIGNYLYKHGSHICDMTHIRKDGTAFPAFESFTLLKDDDGKIVGPLSICRDITQIKETEEMLEESEERYRVLFEDANDAIFIADTETHVILEANKQAERLIARPREEIIGIHQSEFHPSLNQEWYKEEYLDRVEKGRDFEEGAEVIASDGRVIPVFISSNVVSIRGKKVIQSLFRDIDAERRYLDLKEEIIARKLTDKARRILMDRYGINEVEAMNRLRKESRRQSKKLKYISQAVISSELILE